MHSFPNLGHTSTVQQHFSTALLSGAAGSLCRRVCLQGGRPLATLASRMAGLRALRMLQNTSPVCLFVLVLPELPSTDQRPRWEAMLRSGSGNSRPDLFTSGPGFAGQPAAHLGPHLRLRVGVWPLASSEEAEKTSAAVAELLMSGCCDAVILNFKLQVRASACEGSSCSSGDSRPMCQLD